MSLPSKITLVAPALRYRETCLRAAQEFQSEGLAWWIGGDLELAARDFGASVAKRLADAQRRTEALVPKTHLWAIGGERNGGVLRETKAPGPGRPLKRHYWMSLPNGR